MKNDLTKTLTSSKVCKTTSYKYVEHLNLYVFTKQSTGT